MTAGADRKVVFALLAIATLCLVGLGGTVYRAKADQLKRMQRQLAEKEVSLSEIKRKVANQPQLEEKYRQLQSRLSVLEPSLPDSAYIPTFLRQIEGLATGTNNAIIMIRPKPAAPGRKGGAASPVINNETGEIVEQAEAPDAKGAPKAGEKQRAKLPYDYAPIELKVSGTYWTVIDFLSELQRFPKMIAVNDVGFSPEQSKAASQSSPRLLTTVNLTAVVTKGAKDGT